jgi:GH15 family glucan-1,4-alpha-glucosidase
MPLVGFLPADDRRMRATIEAVERELAAGGLIRRWRGDDAGFLICTYWLVECLAMAGQVDRAATWFRSATAHANDLGLLAEEADPVTGELLGNVPQAFSHVGLINAAWRLGQAAPQHRVRSTTTADTSSTAASPADGSGTDPALLGGSSTQGAS